MSVNSEMTAIADLIRGLRGVSGKMGLDAMKGHLQDEQDGLDSALTALAEKGVTVPDGTKVDGLAALIAAIEAGGGSGGMKVVSGSYVSNITEPTSTTKRYISISHELGVIPDLIIVRPTTRYMGGGSCIGWIIAVKPGGKFHFTENLSTIYKTSGKPTGTYSATIVEATTDFTDSSGAICKVTDTSFSIEYNNGSYLKVGEEYVFFAVGG